MIVLCSVSFVAYLHSIAIAGDSQWFVFDAVDIDRLLNNEEPHAEFILEQSIGNARQYTHARPTETRLIFSPPLPITRPHFAEGSITSDDFPPEPPIE